jgi:hypothetical protein
VPATIKPKFTLLTFKPVIVFPVLLEAAEVNKKFAKASARSALRSAAPMMKAAPLGAAGPTTKAGPAAGTRPASLGVVASYENWVRHLSLIEISGEAYLDGTPSLLVIKATSAKVAAAQLVLAYDALLRKVSEAIYYAADKAAESKKPYPALVRLPASILEPALETLKAAEMTWLKPLAGRFRGDLPADASRFRKDAEGPMQRATEELEAANNALAQLVAALDAELGATLKGQLN